MMPRLRRDDGRSRDAGAGSIGITTPGSHPHVAERVIRHVKALIERGALRPGDQLPPERSLAVEIGISRPSLRAGLRALAAMGVVEARHGSGTYIIGGPPVLASEPLRMLAALHGLTRDQLFEVRRLLEVGVAGLAAERSEPEDLAVMADEVAGMFASADDPLQHLAHDMRFHRAVAAGARNPAVGVLIEMVASLFFEQRRRSIEGARDLRESAEQHRGIYLAIRGRDAEKARTAMTDHLVSAQANQMAERNQPAGPRGRGVARRRDPAPLLPRRLARERESR
jgi:GntR family transcriptional repressor for pyruvate dehydrogenase complex